MKCPNCHKSISKKDSVCPHCGKEVVRKKIDFKQILLLIAILIVTLFSRRSIRFFNGILRDSQMKEYTEKYSQLSLDDVIEQNLDEDNTVSHLLAKHYELKSYLDMNGYRITDTNEYVSKSYKKDPLSARLTLYFSKDDGIHYSISINYEKGELIDKELSVDYEKGITDRDVFNAPEDKLNALGKQIGIDNVYFRLKEKHPLMSKKDNRYEYVSNDQYHIVLKEFIEENGILCSYSIGTEV